MQTSEARKEKLPVFLVEDDTALRRNLSNWINRLGPFSMAGDFATAEEALLAIPDCFKGIVVLDVKLPGMTGIDCAKTLAETRSVKTLFISSFVELEAIEFAFHLGGASFLSKPFALDEFSLALRFVVEGASYFSPRLCEVFCDHSGLSKPGPFQAQPELMLRLTPAEQKALILYARGLGYKALADQLHISTNTLDNELASVRHKLKVQTTLAAIFHTGCWRLAYSKR